MLGTTIKLIDNGIAGKRSWPEYLKAHGGDGIFQSGITISGRHETASFDWIAKLIQQHNRNGPAWSIRLAWENLDLV